MNIVPHQDTISSTTHPTPQELQVPPGQPMSTTRTTQPTPQQQQLPATTTIPHHTTPQSIQVKPPLPPTTISIPSLNPMRPTVPLRTKIMRMPSLLDRIIRTERRGMGMHRVYHRPGHELCFRGCLMETRGSHFSVGQFRLFRLLCLLGNW